MGVDDPQRKLGKIGSRACKAELCRITDFLNKREIPYYLDQGTLLGAVREQRFIPWDTDIDLAAPIEYMDDILVGNLKGLKFHNTNHDRCSQIYNKDHNLWTQVFWKTTTDKYVEWVVHHMSTVGIVYKRVPKELLKEFTTIRFMGLDFPIPKRYDEYLTAMYGNWRKVNKKYDADYEDRSNWKIEG